MTTNNADTQDAFPADPKHVPRRSTFSRLALFPAIGEAALAGLICGLMDINETREDIPLSAWFYALSGILMGLRHAGIAWACWPPLGLSLYLVHVVAIAGGLTQPFVEVDIVTASTPWNISV